MSSGWLQARQGQPASSPILHSDELPDISQLLNLNCAPFGVTCPLTLPHSPHQLTAQPLGQLFGREGTSPQTRVSLSQQTQLWSRSASCRLEPPLPISSTAEQLAALQQYSKHEQGCYPPIVYGYPGCSTSVSGVNSTTAACDSRLNAANVPAGVHAHNQQALSQLLRADSAEAVLSIAGDYFDDALRSSSSPTSANTAHSQASMSLDALVRVLEYETTVQQQRQATHEAPVVAAVSLGAAAHNRAVSTVGGNPGSANRVAFDDNLLDAQLCEMLAAAAAALTPASGVSDVGRHSMRSVSNNCGEPNAKRVRLSDTITSASKPQMNAAAGASCLIATPPPAPEISKQLSIPRTTASYDRHVYNAMAAQDATAAGAGGVLPLACFGSQRFTAPAGIVAQSNNGIVHAHVPEATCFLTGRQHALSPASSDVSLVKSLWELQARCSAQAALKGKQQNASERLLARQQRRCRNCVHALHEAVEESRRKLVNDTHSAAISCCNSI